MRLRQISERIPAGRWGEPKDFAGPVVFLASSASQYVCGELLVVDGVSEIVASRFSQNFLVYFYFLGMDGPVNCSDRYLHFNLIECKSRTVMQDGRGKNPCHSRNSECDLISFHFGIPVLHNADSRRNETKTIFPSSGFVSAWGGLGPAINLNRAVPSNNLTAL